MLNLLNALPVATLLIICFTLGLAPFSPPHLYEKFQMLLQGTLTNPIDIGDLLMHGSPWLLLVLKLIIQRTRTQQLRQQ